MIIYFGPELFHTGDIVIMIGCSIRDQLTIGAKVCRDLMSVLRDHQSSYQDHVNYVQNVNGGSNDSNNASNGNNGASNGNNGNNNNANDSEDDSDNDREDSMGYRPQYNEYFYPWSNRRRGGYFEDSEQDIPHVNMRYDTH